MKSFQFIAMIFVAMFSTDIYANCKGRIVVTVDSNNISESYTDAAEVLIPVTVELRQRLTNCTDNIVLEAIGRDQFVMSGPSGDMVAEFLDENGVNLPQYNGNPGLWQLTPSGGVDTLFYVRVLGEQILSPGSYLGTFNVYATDATSVLKEKAARVRYRSPSLVGVLVDTSSSTYINGSNGVYVVDFGELTTGKKVSWQLNVISNASLVVNFSADNQMLIHESDPTQNINYKVLFRDAEVATDGSNIPLESFTGLTSMPVAIEIGDVAYKQAGHYTDQLRVTISAQ
jgi:hypothetical protein